nr:integrase family protein [Microvirga tunisiensis]
MAEWRVLAIEWLKGETHGIDNRLEALVQFFENYLIGQSLPLDPKVLLARKTVLPDFYKTSCPDSGRGVRYNNDIHAFLNFVLLREYTEPDDDGRAVVLAVYHNPVARRSRSGLLRLDESVYSPLPYGYIDELRQMLAQGPHFRDWIWAKSALGAEIGKRGFAAPSWFKVTPDQIDKDDPDCVWRVRPRRQQSGGDVLEMWSPVRWVALLVKLILPLRTFQVRVLDSGEADTWRYDSTAEDPSSTWKLNTHPLTHHLRHGSERKPLQQGVFRRSEALNDGEAVSTVLYISTNKTADIRRSGTEKGYVMPWVAGGPVHSDAFYWLEKLRNWQSKYNPIRSRTSWAELDARHIPAKSEVQLAQYPDACFLFRLPEARSGERHLPMADNTLQYPWFGLLEAFQNRLAARGETHANGAPIRLVPPPAESRGGQATLYPLHSLRVSLVTALALEGQVPFPILQKLVGHSRLLMTLYYTKPGTTHIKVALSDAARRLEAHKEASIQSFLLDTEHDQLLQQAICNSPSSLAATVPEHPASRNPAGWMPMHHGLCLVGGNTSEVERIRSIGGCYNGGSVIVASSTTTQSKYGPVPGGNRNCVRCRWFVTGPHHLPALVAHFNTIAYHFDEARNVCLGHETNLQELKRRRAAAETAGELFGELDALRQAERMWETSMKRFSDLAEDLVACWRLIERCKSAPDNPTGNGTVLVAVGTAFDVNVAFEETESELLQLSVVCQDAEVYPDLEPGKAIIRRSQLLDAALDRDDLPPMFMKLSEQDQLRVGNAFMRHLAGQLDPENPALGQRRVVELIDAGEHLSDYLGVDLDKFVPAGAARPLKPVPNTSLIGSRR